MVRLVRKEGYEHFGYLDNPKCRGPLTPGTCVEFEMWHRGDGDFSCEGPGPVSRDPYPRKRQHEVFAVEVVSIDNEICLMIDGGDEEFFRKHPGFRPV